MAEKIATRKAYGEALVEYAEEYPELVVLEADLAEATMTKFFRDKFPQRFFEMGIAECNMQGVAAGMASCGLKPLLILLPCLLQADRGNRYAIPSRIQV